MASYKKLKGLAHDIAHHSVSGLSFLHPHLRRAAVQKRDSVVLVDLLADIPFPDGYVDVEPLCLALVGLKKNFLRLLVAKGWESSDLSAAKLSFTFDGCPGDDYCVNCETNIKTRAGKEISAAVDFLGRSIKKFRI